RTKLVAEAVFDNDSTAVAAMRGLYSNFAGGTSFASGGASSITYYAALSSDELKTYSTSVDQLGFYTNSISPISTSALPNLWTTPYKTILEANAVIEALNQSNGVSEVIRNQFIGESKFIRAFCHFYLVN